MNKYDKKQQLKGLIIFVLILYFNISIIAQTQRMKFERVSVEQGLSQSTINCILQDSQGFLWVGTIDGLNKYDGYGFKIFKPDPDDPNSISNSYIYNIYEDNESNIWIGTRNGLNKYDRKLEKFIKYFNNPDDSTSLSHNNVRSVYQDKRGNIWIGTLRGLNKFLPQKEAFEIYPYKKNDSTGLNHNFVYCTYEDSQNNFWVGSHAGLHLMDRDKKTFKLFAKNPDNQNSITNNTIKVLMEDRNNILWIGTDGGLNTLDKQRRNFSYFQTISTREHSLKSGGIFDIYQDREGTIWIATWQGGLARYEPSINGFTTYLNVPNDETSISYNSISAICEDEAGILWIGTWGGGLNKYDKQKLKFECIQNVSNDPNGLSNNYVCSVCEDRNGILWIGTWGGGLNRYDRKNDIFKVFQPTESPNSLNDLSVYSIIELNNGELWFGSRGGINIYNPKQDNFSYITSTGIEKNGKIIRKISNNVIRTMYQTADGTIWVGTDAGLNKYVADADTFEVFISDPDDNQTISNNRIRKIIEGNPGYLWVSTAIGLNRFDRKAKTFKRYLHDENNPNSISNDYIWSIAMDKNGIVWIGTSGGGLNKLNPETDEIKIYREKHGLPNDGIWGVQIDNKGYLWLSTNRGLSKFDSEKEQFTNYTTNDGLQSNEFNGGAYFKSRSGEMFFGGYKGLNAFYPESVRKNKYVPPIVITDLQILNEDVEIGNKSQLQKSISLTKELTLTHKDYIFSFEFTSLHFSTPEANKFAYMLEGFNENWVYTNASRRFAYYTNLDQGEYTFKVKGSNSDGVWNPKETSIKITILPPFWETWWFRTLLAAFVIGSAIGWYRWRINSIKQQQIELERLVKERTKEIAQKNLILEEQKSEITQQAEKLELSNIELEKLSIVARETDNAVIIMDGMGNYEWVNEGYTRMFGYTLEQLLEKHKNIIDEKSNEKITSLIKNCISKKQTTNYEFQTISKSDQKLWVQVTLTPIVDDNGNVIKLIAVDSDITKMKEAEEEIHQQAEELKRQAENLQETNFELEKEREHTMGSIRYGLTIQQAILPLKSYIDVFFESFIIYRPKDIVSGDFYWFSNVPSDGTEPDKIFMAVVDCTGHGVPGAFMSMIGNRLLNEIVNEKKMSNPKEILNLMDIGVIKALKQSQTNNDDGMDICLCAIEHKEDDSLKITFSGAKRPVFYYEHGSQKIKILKADRRSIGGYRPKMGAYPFTNKVLRLKNKDIIYLSTDGLIDQNGPERRRFGSPRLIKTLEKNLTKEMDEQKIALEEALDQYQQKEPQRDDITFLGIKL